MFPHVPSILSCDLQAVPNFYARWKNIYCCLLNFSCIKSAQPSITHLSSTYVGIFVYIILEKLWYFAFIREYNGYWEEKINENFEVSGSVVVLSVAAVSWLHILFLGVTLQDSYHVLLFIIIIIIIIILMEIVESRILKLFENG